MAVVLVTAKVSAAHLGEGLKPLKQRTQIGLTAYDGKGERSRGVEATLHAAGGSAEQRRLWGEGRGGKGPNNRFVGGAVP